MKLSCYNKFYFLKRYTKNYFKSNEFNMTKKFLSNSLVFVLFSFLNVSLPIFICLITSRVDDKAAYATIGIGFITSFQLAYSQIGFAFAIFASCLILKKDKEENHRIVFSKSNIAYDALLLALIYGIIITPLYIGPCWIYNKYANEHYNTIDSIQPANLYIFSSSGFILLTTLSWTLIFLIYNKTNSFNALIQILISFGSTLLLSSTLSLLTPLKYIGVGLGLTLGTLFSCFCSFIHCLIKTSYFKKSKYLRCSIKTLYFKKIIQIKWINIKEIFRNVWRQTLMVISIQIFKAVALIVLNFQIPEKLVDSVPLNYQMARLIWYNLLYLIPFLILGFSDSSYYFFIKNEPNIHEVDFGKIIPVIIGIAFIFTIGIVVASSYLVYPLSDFYIKNQNHSYGIDFISANVQKISKDTIIQTINSTSQIPKELKEKLISIIQSNNPQTSTIVDQILKEVTENILLPKFTKFDASSINELINLPNSFTYIYISIYCILYPLGTLLNSFFLSIKNEKPKALFMVVAQGVAIAFIVEFGINFQENNRFYLMEAWSFPLAIIGIVAFIYLSFNFFIQLSKKK